MHQHSAHNMHVEPSPYSVSDLNPLKLDSSHKSELMFATRSKNSEGTRLFNDKWGLQVLPKVKIVWNYEKFSCTVKLIVKPWEVTVKGFRLIDPKRPSERVDPGRSISGILRLRIDAMWCRQWCEEVVRTHQHPDPSSSPLLTTLRLRDWPRLNIQILMALAVTCRRGRHSLTQHESWTVNSGN